MPRNITIQELFDAGVHHGHLTRKWNPKMSPYIFGKRNGIHIIDLSKTLPMLQNALEAIKNVTSNYGRVLFVGTKNQAADLTKEAAEKCGQYYVNDRWLGGLLTNWKTIQQSIKKMKELENTIIVNPTGFTKQEITKLKKQLEKLNSAIGGVRNMGGIPDLIVIIDTNMEKIAVKEACKLGIPVVAVVDSDADPENINYVIPGNDDAIKSIKLYCELFAEAALEGLQQGMIKSGIDVGTSENILELVPNREEPNKDKKNKGENNKTENNKQYLGRKRFRTNERQSNVLGKDNENTDNSPKSPEKQFNKPRRKQ